MPFQSQSSGGLLDGQLSSTTAAERDAVGQVEQAFALLGERLRDLAEQPLVDLLRLLRVGFLEVEPVAPEFVDVLAK